MSDLPEVFKDFGKQLYLDDPAFFNKLVEVKNDLDSIPMSPKQRSYINEHLREFVNLENFTLNTDSVIQFLEQDYELEQ